MGVEPMTMTTHLMSKKPFPSSLEPLFQSESKCEVFEMKMRFHSYGKQN